MRALCRRDQRLAGVVRELGSPPLWARQPGFATLVRIILEQQVSLASAKAAFERLEGALGRITPSRFLSLDRRRLKTIGFSRQKASYCRGLALGLAEGELDLAALSTLGDAAAREQLLGIRGVGPWTADIYLLMALRRPDVWPAGDLALVAAARRVTARAEMTSRELEVVAERWRPWRSVAARILWHRYLCGARQAAGTGADAVCRAP